METYNDNDSPKGRPMFRKARLLESYSVNNRNDNSKVTLDILPKIHRAKFPPDLGEDFARCITGFAKPTRQKEVHKAKYDVSTPLRGLKRRRQTLSRADDLLQSETKTSLREGLSNLRISLGSWFHHIAPCFASVAPKGLIAQRKSKPEGQHWLWERSVAPPKENKIFAREQVDGEATLASSRDMVARWRILKIPAQRANQKRPCSPPPRPGVFR
ncbi:hypothetical protein RRG08_000224 [Elysia crispata]|uniref:Uncharacterized protein n=1 Tax=Elysia crispata TaxID=231223 RepID=A0AAE1AY07_9GAST|nr:hypothetical protein RRG08_000224 [Elysia crispata]